MMAWECDGCCFTDLRMYEVESVGWKVLLLCIVIYETKGERVALASATMTPSKVAGPR